MGDYQQDFFDLLESLSEDEWELKVNDKWSVKDVVAHLIGWEEECAVSLMDSWQTGKKPWFMKTDDYDEFNRKSVMKYKNYTPKQLIERWKFVIRVLDSEIDDIGIGRLKAKGELFDWLFDESHYEEHLEQIKKALRIPDNSNSMKKEEEI